MVTPKGDEVEVQRDAYDPDGADGDGDPVDVSTFENITGSDHNDRLTGDHRANELKGGKGNDNLRGMAGVDTLNGGPGADHLDGGEDARERDNMVPDPVDADPSDGTDMIAASIDIASYAGAMAGVTVNLDNGRGTAGDAMKVIPLSISRRLSVPRTMICFSPEKMLTISMAALTTGMIRPAAMRKMATQYPTSCRMRLLQSIWDCRQPMQRN